MAKTMGRPQRLTAKVERNGQILTVAEALLADIRDGLPLDLACRRSAMRTPTLYRYFQDGARLTERQLVNPNHAITPNERRIMDFCSAVEQARAEAQARYLGSMDKLSMGFRTVRVERKVDPNDIDPATGEPRVIEEKRIFEEVHPSERALRWILENSYGMGRPQEVNVHVDGQPALSEPEAIENVIEAIEAFAREHPDDESGPPALPSNGNGR